VLSFNVILDICTIGGALAEMSSFLATQPTAWPRPRAHVQLKLQLERAADHAHSRFTGERDCGRWPRARCWRDDSGEREGNAPPARARLVTTGGMPANKCFL